MTEPAPVPWPGTEPEPFEFPFAEAATARAALEELHTELTDVESIHSAAFGGISALNQGETIRRFASGYFDRMGESASVWLQVVAAKSDLDDLVARAHVVQQERADAHAAWSVRNAAYQQALTSGAPVGGRSWSSPRVNFI